MVKFKVYKRDKLPDVMANVDRRLTRVKNQSRLPLGVWANWIVEGNYVLIITSRGRSIAR